jgi:cytochrome P450
MSADGKFARIRILSQDLAQRMLENDHNRADSHFKKPSSTKSVLSEVCFQHALTTSSGDDWCRMRPAVERALGGGMAALRQRYSSACCECAEACCRLIDESVRHTKGVLDVRKLAAVAAGRGMTVAAVGGWDDCDSHNIGENGVCGRDAQIDLETALKALFSEALCSLSSDRKKCEDLWNHTSWMVAAALERSSTLDAPQQEGCTHAASAATKTPMQRPKSVDTQPTSSIAPVKPAPPPPQDKRETLLGRLVRERAVLSAGEVQDNLHSALIAGFQATSVLTTFMILHLSMHPRLQEAIHQEAKAAAASVDRSPPRPAQINPTQPNPTPVRQ